MTKITDTPEVALIKCSVCAYEYAAGVKFCTRCGARTPEAPSKRKRSTKTVVPRADNPAQPKTAKPRKPAGNDLDDSATPSKSKKSVGNDLNRSAVVEPAQNDTAQNDIDISEPSGFTPKPAGQFSHTFNFEPIREKLRAKKSDKGDKKRKSSANKSKKRVQKKRPRKKSAASRAARERMLSIISMLTLIIIISGFSLWAVYTNGGRRTMARVGIGGAVGYMLIGDDALYDGNYAHAVECYYKSLSRATKYDTAFKLARAYALSGETEDAARALMLCIDLDGARDEPYEYLKALYPDAAARPENVKNALSSRS